MELAPPAPPPPAPPLPPPRAPPRPAPWRPLNSILLALLMGTRSPESPLSCLRGSLAKTLLPIIWAYFDAEVRRGIRSHGAAYVKVPQTELLKWPLHKNASPVNISMMPFRVGMKGSLPLELQRFWPLIEQIPFGPDDKDSIAYLTIQESVVQKGDTQRRCGLHTESPGFWVHDLVAPKMHMRHYGGWGGGIMVEEPKQFFGGIFMMASPYGACRIWSTRVDPSLVGPHGDCEHLRPWLNGIPSIETDCGMYWITDLTPHEVLPAPVTTVRKFLRVVTKDLCEWYSDMYTHNPIVKPACKIVYGNKFKEAAATSTNTL